MEKLLHRSILNRNQLVNKKRKELAKGVRKTWRDFNRMQNLKATEMSQIVKNERIARREDWMMGSLAPKRDVGTKKGTYGAISNILAQGARLPRREVSRPSGKGTDAYGTEDRRMPGFEDGEWRGIGLRGNLVIGDRVVVTKGRIGVKGKVGKVVKIDLGADMVFVKGVNKVDVRIPPQARTSTNKDKIFEQEFPISISDILLITQLSNTVTGINQDVIVRQVHGGAPYEQRPEGSSLPRHTRYITGGVSGSDEHIPLAWPSDEPGRFFTQVGDTTRDLVEQVTYTPGFGDGSLIPESVADELRNKHARTRRDFDDVDMMRRKLLEDARKDWFAERSKVLSQPFWTKEYMLREMKAREEREREKLGVEIV